MSNYKISIEDIASGAPGYISPLSVSFSPNGKQLTYLFPDQTGKRQLFCIDVDKISWDSSRLPIYKLMDASKSDDKLSLEEQLRRERMRLFTEGISSYEWAQDFVNGPHQLMLIPLGAKLFLYDNSINVVEERCKMIYDGSLGSAIDPHLSPDGKHVAFVINNDLYIQALLEEGGDSKPVRITCDGEFAGKSSGVADYIAQEEMNRYRGFWWSPDSQHIVYTRNDESHIPLYTIHHQGHEDPTHSETHRFPFAGKANPLVDLALINIQDIKSGSKILPVVDINDTRYHTLPITAPTKEELSSSNADNAGKIEYYICRVGWWPDGSIMVQVQNRLQNVLQVLRIDPVLGDRTILLEEVSSTYINIHDLCAPLSASYTLPKNSGTPSKAEKDFYFLWGSERNGYMQLYLYQYHSDRNAGECLSGEQSIGPAGKYVVDSILSVDEVNHVVYYQGNYPNPTECHAYFTSFLPQPLQPQQQQPLCLTSHLPGWHSTTVNTKYHLLLDIYQSVTQSILVSLHSYCPNTGKILQSMEIYDAQLIDKRVVMNPSLFHCLVTPEIHRLSTITKQGEALDLYTAVYLPEGVHLSEYLTSTDTAGNGNVRPPSFPTIVAIYGGPHVQRVQNNWLLTADIRTQRLVQQGYVVIKCDNRGSSRRGKHFEEAVFQCMGEKELQDQMTVVKYYSELGLVEAEAVGIVGWSYGGFMSAFALCQSEGVFKAAVAGAPVTFWEGYDTHYTERYMGLPQLNTSAYATTSSVLALAKYLTGDLMLIHGVIDENVHLRHTTRLIQQLIEARKTYEFVLLPNSRHGPQAFADKVYVEERISEFFHRTLKEQTGKQANPVSKTDLSTPQVGQVVSCVVVAKKGGVTEDIFSLSVQDTTDAAPLKSTTPLVPQTVKFTASL